MNHSFQYNFQNYIAKFGFSTEQVFTFVEYHILFLQIMDHYLRREISGETCYSFLSAMTQLSAAQGNPKLEELQKVIIDVLHTTSPLVLDQNRPSLSLNQSGVVVNDSFFYNTAIQSAINYYQAHKRDLFINLFDINQVPDKIFTKNPNKVFRAYSFQYGIDTAGELTFEQFRWLFLKVIDDYLCKRINIEIFSTFISLLEFTKHPEKRGQNLSDLQPDEIIEYLDNLSSFSEIKKHEPTLELVEKTEITERDYPHDWPMREALKYYKKHRYLLDDKDKNNQ